MIAVTPDSESVCRDHINRFFAAYPNKAMQKRAYHALRLLRANGQALSGKAEGWAAGIIYAVFNDGKIPVGVPDVLNSDFERLMGVTMSTVRKRAARVREMFTY